MAVTKTSSIQGIHISYRGEEVPVVEIYSQHTWDDPDDSELPVTNTSSRVITKTTSTTTYDENTGEATVTSSATDYSGESAVIVAICDAVWGD